MNPELQSPITPEPKKRNIRSIVVRTLGLAPSVILAVLGVGWFGYAIIVSSGTAASIAIPFIFIILIVFLFVLAVDVAIQFLLWSKPAWHELYLVLTRFAVLIWLMIAIKNGEFSSSGQQVDVLALIQAHRYSLM